MSRTTITGKVFWKKLRKLGIPASIFAMKAKCSLDKIYQLKDSERVPSKYVNLLEELSLEHKAQLVA